MISVLDSESCDTNSSPVRYHCFDLLSRTLYSHNTSSHPGVLKRTSQFYCSGQHGDQTISELPKASLSKRGLVHNHSYENEFNLHVNEISFSYERMSTKTRFEKEAKGNSEMAY